jgi:hypothetical protein
MDEATQATELMAEAAGGVAPEAPADPVEDPSAALLARLREAWLAADPSVPATLVHGETLDELEVSFAAAKDVAARAREEARREAALAVPAGAPGRLPAAPATPLEKIRAGLVRL